jgi:hypothetical protein
MAIRAAKFAQAFNPVTSLGERVSAFEQAQALPRQEVARLRGYILKHCPSFEDEALVQFVRQAFESDEVVEAYFYPKMLSDGPSPQTTPSPVMLVPFEQALGAARQTYLSPLLACVGALDRNLAFVASLLYPCGLFLRSHPAQQVSDKSGPPGPPGPISSALATEISALVLGPALTNLRQTHRGIAQALATALGHCPVSGNCSELLCRVVTAVYLPNMRLSALWGAPAEQDRGTRS